MLRKIPVCLLSVQDSCRSLIMRLDVTLNAYGRGRIARRFTMESSSRERGWEFLHQEKSNFAHVSAPAPMWLAITPSLVGGTLFMEVLLS